MTAFDYIVLAVLGFSILLSVMRGLVKEVLSILAWFVAFYVGRTYTDQMLPLIPTDIPSESLRTLAAFLVLFLATLLLATLLAIAISAIFKKIGLGWLNRMLGAVFGALRGGVLLLLVATVVTLTPAAQSPSWQASSAAPVLLGAVKGVKMLLPPELARWIPG